MGESYRMYKPVAQIGQRTLNGRVPWRKGVLHERANSPSSGHWGFHSLFLTSLEDGSWGHRVGFRMTTNGTLVGLGSTW